MAKAMAISPHFAAQGRFSDWRLATQSIIGFWSFYLVTVLLRGLFGPEAASAIGYRAINAAIGLVLTFLIYAAVRFFAREGSIRRMAGPLTRTGGSGCAFARWGGPDTPRR